MTTEEFKEKFPEQYQMVLTQVRAEELLADATRQLQRATDSVLNKEAALCAAAAATEQKDPPSPLVVLRKALNKQSQK